MRKLVILPALILALVAIGCGLSAAQTGTDTKPQTTTISVPTVKCDMCVETITKAVKKLKGVQTVKVDLEAKTTTVAYDPLRVDAPKLEKAIANAGYDANGVKRASKAYAKLPACCK